MWTGLRRTIAQKATMLVHLSSCSTGPTLQTEARGRALRCRRLSRQSRWGRDLTKQLVVKCPSWISSVRIAQNQILKEGPVQRCRNFSWVKCHEQDNVTRELLSPLVRMKSPRGSSPGPGGCTYEHLQVLLEDSNTFDLLIGIATGTTLRRIGRTLAKEFQVECSAKPPGFHTTTREPKRAHLRVPAIKKNTTKIQREDTQRGKKRTNFAVGEGKNEILGGPGEGRSRGRAVQGRAVPGRAVPGRAVETNTHTKYPATQTTHNNTTQHTTQHTQHTTHNKSNSIWPKSVPKSVPPDPPGDPPGETQGWGLKGKGGGEGYKGGGGGGSGG